MEKLFEKILHEMRSRISFLLAFVVSLIVFIVNPKGVFHFIFESIFQYTQNKILSFSFSFSSIFLFFYSFFFIVGKVYRWCEVKKYEQDLIDQKIALKIHQFPDKIKKELYECYSKKQNKIPRTDELDRLIGRLDLIGFFKLRNFFEPTESDYIVKPDVLRAIKKYHEIAFKSIYWQQNK
ncbi:hypothetical protein [Helicobacter pylori]|uniref:hypothetical protein n=1 Tax=Helicobacter pylori TaxID=210 RepID=UPI0018D00C25|nr:hypothetical protein [Helicobacter pylori]MBH0277889.1 hypothetical protein [Helicobacter pylori]MBH0280804.1 hypothetical protein [Helicobacter pylori]MBH0284370.1 hypothetical protein [Helicobacter pylori]